MHVLFVRDFYCALKCALLPKNNTRFMSHIFKNEENMFWLLNLSTKWWMCLPRSSYETTIGSVLLYLSACQKRQLCNQCRLTWSKTEGETNSRNTYTRWSDQQTESVSCSKTLASSFLRGQRQNNPDAFVWQQICPYFPHEKMWSKIGSFGDSVWDFTSIWFASSEVSTCCETCLHVHLCLSSRHHSSSGG